MNPESVLRFTHPTLPLPGNSLEVAPGIHWVRMPLPFALDHVNLWLLEDAEHWVLVDCGLGNHVTRSLWQQLFSTRLAGASVSRVIATHHHPDHVGNAGWLAARFNAPLWMSLSEYLTVHLMREGHGGHAREDYVSMFRANGLEEQRASKLLRGTNTYRGVVPEFPCRFQRLRDGDTLAIGGRGWRVIMGYGHAPEHAALYCESLGVFISGDMMLPKISTNVSVPASQPDADPLKLFLESIARYARLPADTLVLPSHGLPFRGLRERVAQLEEHHRLRLAELRDACEAPRCAAEMIDMLFKRELDNMQMFFAMGEALAHMHYLQAQGLARREVRDGVIRFARV
jgi:glyoxylase-like metal-dependent hydrolase (beta-lactamase superfamily II)